MFYAGYTQNKTLNIFANVLQMFYFTCNHGLSYGRVVRLPVCLSVDHTVALCQNDTSYRITTLHGRITQGL